MNGKLKDKVGKEYVSLGITIFLSGAALIVLFMSMNRYESLVGMLTRGMSIISPFVYGIVLAYLLTPIFDFFVRKFYALLDGKVKFRIGKSKDPALTLSKILSTIITLVIFATFMTGFGFLVIPKIIESLSSLAIVLPQRVSEIIKFIQETEKGGGSPVLSSAIEWLQN